MELEVQGNEQILLNTSNGIKAAKLPRYTNSPNCSYMPNNNHGVAKPKEPYPYAIPHQNDHASTFPSF